MSNKNIPKNPDQTASVANAVQNITRLPKDLFLKRIGEPDMTIIDIRTKEEFDSGHIDNAINIDFYSPSFIDDLEKLDKTKSYSIYCRSGSRSGQALGTMKNAGFSDVADLLGGYSSL